MSLRHFFEHPTPEIPQRARRPTRGVLYCWEPSMIDFQRMTNAMSCIMTGFISFINTGFSRAVNPLYSLNFLVDDHMTMWSDLRFLSRSGSPGKTALLPADREEPQNCLSSESHRRIGYHNRVLGFRPPWASHSRDAERFVVSSVPHCIRHSCMP